MLKSIQIKIVLIFMIIGILLIGTQGILFTIQLNKIQVAVDNNQNITQVINILKTQTRVLSLILLIVFAVISILVGFFVIKMIISPIARLTKSAEIIAKGLKYQIKYLDGGKVKTEVDELTKAFNMMHTELNGNLKEVSRQKRQIETILLHMNDGILAFNIDGEIIHKNNAAIKLLELTGDEKSFSDVFDKINSNINLYLLLFKESRISKKKFTR